MSKQEPGVVTTKQQLLDDPFMKSVVQDGMRIEWDVPLHMRDGVTLRADAVSYTHLDVYKRQPWKGGILPSEGNMRIAAT